MSDCKMPSDAPAAPFFHAPSPAPTPAPERLLFIDNLRWFAIVLVVMLHLWVTYGPVGSWYYSEFQATGRRLDLPTTLLFFFLCAATQAWFMGLLFLIAGYFVPPALAAKGPRRFVRDRLHRLGLPALLFMLVLHPLTVTIHNAFLGEPPLHTLAGYPRYLYTFRFVGCSGPLWFALALLIFSLIAARLRPLAPSSPPPAIPASPCLASTPPLNRAAALLVVALGLGSFLVRLVQPIGTSVVNMQLCFFPQYIVLFILGMKAHRLDLLRRIPSALGMRWFKAALFAGIPLWCIMGLAGGTDFSPYAGGAHWQAAAYAFWEAFICVGVCLGMIVLFRERFNCQGPLAAFMSQNAFGVYVTHAPVLVLVTMAVRGLALHPALKCALMSALLVPLCFGVSRLCRRLPLLGRIL